MAEISIKDLREVADFMINLGQGIDNSLKDDGVLTVSDLPNILPTLMSVVPALEGIGNVPITIKAMSEDEKNELYKYIADKLTLSDKDTEKFIEDALRVVLDLWMVINKYFLKAIPDNTTK